VKQITKQQTHFLLLALSSIISLAIAFLFSYEKTANILSLVSFFSTVMPLQISVIAQPAVSSQN